MKKIIISLGLFCAGIIHSQVAIGKQTIEGDGILDFEENTTNGILLPIVETLPANAVGGTILMDKNDKTVKMNIGSAWVPLSDVGSTANVVFNPSSESSAQNNVIIGSPVSTTPGVLVLESTNKALILPKVSSPDTAVRNPYPGMICYDPISKTMAVFDGLKWSFWK